MSEMLRDWRKNPQPDRVPWILDEIAKMELLDGRHDSELPMSAAILALAEAYPDLAGDWERAHPSLFKQARKLLASADKTRPGLNDALALRWFVLGRKEDALAMRSACRLPGPRGHSATWMVRNLTASDPELALLLAEA